MHNQSVFFLSCRRLVTFWYLSFSLSLSSQIILSRLSMMNILHHSSYDRFMHLSMLHKLLSSGETMDMLSILSIFSNSLFMIDFCASLYFLHWNSYLLTHALFLAVLSFMSYSGSSSEIKHTLFHSCAFFLAVKKENSVFPALDIPNSIISSLVSGFPNLSSRDCSHRVNVVHFSKFISMVYILIYKSVCFRFCFVSPYTCLPSEASMSSRFPSTIPLWKLFMSV